MTAPGAAAQSPLVMSFPPAIRVCAVLATVALVGCSFDGTSPYAGMTTWEDGTHSARVRYLESPWRLRGGDGVETLEIEVDPVTGADSGVPPKYQLNVEVVTGSAAGVLAADHASEPSRGEMDLPSGTVAIRTDSDDMGVGFVGVVPGLFARYFLHVAFDIAGGRVLHVVVEANLDPRVPEILAMLGAADVQPFSPP